MQEELRAAGRLVIVAFVVVAVIVLGGLVNAQASVDLARIWAITKELGSEWLTILLICVTLLGTALVLRWGLNRIYG